MTTPTPTPISDLLDPSDELQNQLIGLAQKILLKEPLTAAEQALLEKIKAVKEQLQR